MTNISAAELERVICTVKNRSELALRNRIRPRGSETLASANSPVVGLPTLVPQIISTRLQAY